MIGKTVKISMLFDYYGDLLTDKQKEILKLYYYQDLSLGEISDNINISRQGVYDHLHRAENSLKKYEESLNLIKKNKNNIKLIKEISSYLKDSEDIKSEDKEFLLKRINKIHKNI